MYLILRVDQLNEGELQMWVKSRPSVLTQSAGLVLNMGYSIYWASCADKDCYGNPKQITTVRTPTCSRTYYRNLANVSCLNPEYGYNITSAYNIPAGEDKYKCALFFDYVMGNEFTVTWRPEPGLNISKYYVIQYWTEHNHGDCSFEFGLCDWIQFNSSYSPILWKRTSEELVIQYADVMRQVGILELPHIVWDDHRMMTYTKEQVIIGYYLHLHMDRDYPGEKAAIATPLLNSDIRRKLSFKYHMHGKTVGHLNVYTWIPATNAFSIIWSNHGEQSISWHTVEGIAASACHDYHVIFEGTIPGGMIDGEAGDIAIDDVYFCELPVSTADAATCSYRGYNILAEPNTYNNEATSHCCCQPGWTGPHCNRHVNLCTAGSFVCENGGACITWVYQHEYLIPALCRCTSGWSGKNCQIETDECQSDPCSNGGRCVDGFNSYHCICPLYYYGPNCELRFNICLDKTPCQNSAQCINVGLNDFRCICKLGFTGENCGTEINECVSNPCLNSGTCIDKINGYMCFCVSGYHGEYCALNDNNCLAAMSEGWCNNAARCRDTVNGYQCSCSEGWTGQFCDQQINRCLTDQCIHGRCVQRFLNFQCICEDGYTGTRCEKKIDFCLNNRCINGYCINQQTSYRCDCLNGYSGQFCDVRFNPCISSPCADGSTCQQTDGGFYCSCGSGKIGPYCLNKVDYCSTRDSCLNGGLCISTDTNFYCRCLPGYRGHLCEQEASSCQGQPCVYGTCVDKRFGEYECRCVEGFGGEDCGLEIHGFCNGDPCLNNSTCIDVFNDYVCRCQTGYFGADCQIDIDECESSPCYNGGLCANQINSYHCECPNPWSGRNCDIRIDLCDELHCIHGECILESGSARCDCDEGFTGEHCDLLINNCASQPCHSTSTCYNLVKDYYCQCSPALPLIGPDCSLDVDVCASRPCMNGGSCRSVGFSYTCNCPSNTRGENCQYLIRPCNRNPCLHGTCINIDEATYECRCDAGWASPQCRILLDLCRTYTCDNGGTCRLLVSGQPTCFCPDKYTGLRCQQMSNACSGKICYNGGYCTVGKDGVLNGIGYCRCQKEFTGYFCEVELSTGIEVGGARKRRELSTSDFELEPNPTSHLSCHPLGDDTTTAVKSLIVAVTAACYIIVFTAAIVHTFIRIRLHRVRSARSVFSQTYSDINSYQPKHTDMNRGHVEYDQPGERGTSLFMLTHADNLLQ